MSRFTKIIPLILFLLVLSPAVGRLQAQGALPLPPNGPPEETPAGPAPVAFDLPENAAGLTDFFPPQAQVAAVSSSGRGNPAVGVGAANAPQVPVPVQRDVAVTAADGRLGVIFGAQTVSRTATLTVHRFEQMERGPDYTPPGRADSGNHPAAGRMGGFKLDLYDTGGREISAFDKQVRLVVDMREYDVDLSEVGGRFYLAYEDESRPGSWINVPIVVHDESGLISADVDHFSDWQFGWRPEAWALEWKPPVNNEFTGAATYQYGMELPAGRNGLQPAVGLSYSSASLRGAIRTVSHGNVATGWSLSDIKIIRTGIEIESGSSWAYPNTFRLTVNGSGGRMVETGVEDGATVYRVEDAPQFKVYNYGGTSLTDAQSYWVVRTSDGRHYRLGYTVDSISTQRTKLNNSQTGHEIVSWHVDTVTDASGNQMNYDYQQVVIHESTGFYCPWGGICGWDIYTTNSQVAEITYNFADRISALPPAATVNRLSDAAGADAATRVRFVYQGDGAINGAEYLSRVEVFHLGVQVRRYMIGTQFHDQSVYQGHSCEYRKDSGKHEILVSTTRQLDYIEEQSRDAGGNWQALPRTTFGYRTLPHYPDGDQSCFFYRYLQSVANGYGGSTTFSYISDQRAIGELDNCKGWQAGDDPCEQKWPEMGYNYMVRTVRHDDGVNPATKTAYWYADRCYDQVLANQLHCPQPETKANFGPVAGHGLVIVTRYDFDDSTPLNRTHTYYHLDQEKFGRPYRQYEGGYPQGSYERYGWTTTDYQTLTLEGGVRFVTTEEVRNYQRAPENGGVMSSKTRYVYDDTYQLSNHGRKQFGQVTHVYHYDHADAAAPYKTDRYWHRIRDEAGYWQTVNIEQSLYEGDGSGTPVVKSRRLYDNLAFGAFPSQGRLTQTRQLIPCGEVVAAWGTGCSSPHATVEAHHQYDAYGNMTATTDYSDYGRNNVAPQEARTTEVAYDTRYHLYPLAVTDSAGFETRFEIYGINVAGTQLAHQAGKLRQVTTPNGVTAVYEYDLFGRLHAVYENEAAQGDRTNPWDGDPVSRYRYWDNNWNHPDGIWLNPAAEGPFLITTQQRPNDSAGQSTQTFYDGFGRVIQTLSKSHNIDGHGQVRDIFTVAEYDALGRAVCESTPFHRATYAGRGLVWPASPYLREDCQSQSSKTVTEYDPMGQVRLVTAPDGTETEHRYAIVNDGGLLVRYHNIIDGNDHRLRHAYDVRGNLVAVTEFTGECGSYWGVTCEAGEQSWSDYATTRYSYDFQDNLRFVTDAHGNVTEMRYDSLGRKIWMDDPDMGVWVYGHNAAGNMVTQVDAAGQRLCFYYDDLDRMIVKGKGSSSGCTMPGRNTANWLAGYTYGDEASKHEIGQLVRVEWPGKNGGVDREAFTYDAQSRLHTHTRTIDGESYRMETLVYDLYDRPLRVRYPNGEVVEMTYDREGGNRLTVDGATLVDDVRHNAQGQVTHLQRHNARNYSRYVYYAAGANGEGNHRLNRIKHYSNGSLMSQFYYEYDPVGNITRLADSGFGNTYYEYDTLNRLVEAEIVSLNQTRQYQYDELGNITNFNGWEYAYEDERPHAVTSINDYDRGKFYTYDDNGNMTVRREGLTEYDQVFDLENRLESVTVDGRTTSFYYDSSGGRTTTVRPDGSNVYTPFPNYEREVGYKPGVRLTSNKATVSAGESFRLDWSSTIADSCQAGGRWSGSRAVSGSLTRSHGTAGTYTYSLTCTNEYGSETAQVTVNVLPPPPTVNLTVNNQSSATVEPREAFTLAWSSSNATSCAASGIWSGSKPRSGSETHSGTKTVTYRYALTCVNAAGVSAADTVYVTVQDCGFACACVVCTFDEPESHRPFENGMVWDELNRKTAGKLPATADLLVGGKSAESGRLSAARAAQLIGERVVIERVTYTLNGQSVAVRVSGHPDASQNGTFYLHVDHLGSHTVQTNRATGQKVAASEARFYPFGGYRTAPTEPLTGRGYTGHRHNDDLGLIYMNARYYVPGIGRFASADTIVPDPANPQAFNRYSYVYNNPFNFVDPSGHAPKEDSLWGDYLSGGETWVLFNALRTEPAKLQNQVDSIMTNGVTFGASVGAGIGTTIGYGAGIPTGVPTVGGSVVVGAAVGAAVGTTIGGGLGYLVGMGATHGMSNIVEDLNKIDNFIEKSFLLAGDGTVKMLNEYQYPDETGEDFTEVIRSNVTLFHNEVEWGWDEYAINIYIVLADGSTEYKTIAIHYATYEYLEDMLVELDLVESQD